MNANEIKQYTPLIMFFTTVAIGLMFWFYFTSVTAGDVGKAVGTAVAGTVVGATTGVVNAVAPNTIGKSAKLGEQCSTDLGCMSGLTCCNDKCVAVDILEDNQPCCDDTQCKNKRCAWAQGPDGVRKKICCKNATYDASNSKWMCHNLPQNWYCENHDWCSGYNSSGYDKSMCLNKKCIKMSSRCPNTSALLYEKADGTGKSMCYGVGKYSAVHPDTDKGWKDATSAYNDEFQYTSVPTGYTMTVYDNDSGDTTGWYGWSTVKGPYTGILGGSQCTGKCVSHSGSRGNLGTEGKATSWTLQKS